MRTSVLFKSGFLLRDCLALKNLFKLSLSWILASLHFHLLLFQVLWALAARSALPGLWGFARTMNPSSRCTLITPQVQWISDWLRTLYKKLNCKWTLWWIFWFVDSGILVFPAFDFVQPVLCCLLIIWTYACFLKLLFGLRSCTSASSD